MASSVSATKGAANLLNWVRRKIVAAVNKALRDIGKATAQVAENGVAEAERAIQNGQKVGANVSKNVNSAAKSVGKKMGF